jgi:hypothetical protein
MDISSATEPLWLWLSELCRDGGHRLAGEEAIGLERPLLIGFDLEDGDDRAAEPPAGAVFPLISEVNLTHKLPENRFFKIR